MKRYQFHAAARAEYDAALVWYAERSQDAAAGWIDLVSEGINSICATPDAWPLWRGRTDVRRRVLKRFPYSLVYLVHEDQVVILAVAHHKRRPGYWLPRLRAEATRRR